VAILRPEHYDDWLSSTNPEFARAVIELYPADELSAQPAPKVVAKKGGEMADDMRLQAQANLF
jgi:putative SOS response-associated peptidase YedK